MLLLMQLTVTPQPGLPATGMMFPGNCKPVRGSITLGVAPLEFLDREKLPCLSSNVGTVTVTGSVGEIVCGFSNEKKKRSEEHTSELQSRGHLVCRLLLEKKK